MRTLILFLSDGKNFQEVEYTTDRKFTVRGAQTNEAPVRYAIARLARKKEKLDRIIALVTSKARETAFTRFKEIIDAEAPLTSLKDISIEDNETTTDLLRKTIEELKPISAGDSVIIETTGGYRKAISTLTLLSRFLSAYNVVVDFSTYSDHGAKHVADTGETDKLFDLLEAAQLFAETANPRLLIKALDNVEIPNKAMFESAVTVFYEVVICCKMNSLDEAVKNMRKAVESVINAEYDTKNARALIFRDVISETVRNKFKFIFKDDYLLQLVRWCCENGYLQQAVTILAERVLSYMVFNKQKEKFIRFKTEIGKKLDSRKYRKIIKLRDELNHAYGTTLTDSAEQIKFEVLSVVEVISNGLHSS